MRWRTAVESHQIGEGARQRAQLHRKHQVDFEQVHLMLDER